MSAKNTEEIKVTPVYSVDDKIKNLIISKIKVGVIVY
jgi:hypothetical protein